jgi:diacylglycerol kinase (ATP)
MSFIQRRLLNTFSYSVQGLKAAWQSEEAVRVEMILLPFVIVGGLWLGNGPIEKLMMIGVGFLVLIVELLNSGIEKCIDRISLDVHPLSKYAKDVGSAAVFCSLSLFVITWGVILWSHVAKP